MKTCQLRLMVNIYTFSSLTVRVQACSKLALAWEPQWLARSTSRFKTSRMKETSPGYTAKVACMQDATTSILAVLSSMTLRTSRSSVKPNWCAMTSSAVTKSWKKPTVTTHYWQMDRLSMPCSWLSRSEKGPLRVERSSATRPWKRHRRTSFPLKQSKMAKRQFLMHLKH